MRICRALGGMDPTIAAAVARRSAGYRPRLMSRPHRVRLVALLLAALLALPSGVALAQSSSPFGSLPSAPADTTTTTTQPTTSSSTGGGLSTIQAILVVVAGVGVITAIGLWIARDARRRAPLTAGDTESAHLAGDAHKHGQATKRRQRAKAKAARRQRRRNR